MLLQLFVAFLVAPSKVQIENERVAVQANKPLELLCRAFESRPAAKLSWLKANEPIQNNQDQDQDQNEPNKDPSGFNLHAPKGKITQQQKLTNVILDQQQQQQRQHILRQRTNSSHTKQQQQSNNNNNNNEAANLIVNYSESRLVFVPRIEDSGQTISCVATNLALNPSISIQDSWTLEVNFLPLVKLQLGQRIQADQIRENTDVYMECSVEAKPAANEVRWWFEGRELETNLTEGVFISNQSLVLQRVSRNRRGKYACSASNSLGESRSNDLFLRVLFAPICRSDLSSSSGQSDKHVGVFGAAKMEQVRVQCQVEADPMDSLSFKWAFVPATDQANSLKQHSTSMDNLNSKQNSDNNNNYKNDNDDVSNLAANGVASYTPRAELDYGSLLCWATNSIGSQREACAYKIVPAERPEPVSACRLANASHSQLAIACKPGFNGGLQQTLRMEVYARDQRILVANVTNQEITSSNMNTQTNSNNNGQPNDVDDDSDQNGLAASLVLDQQQQQAIVSSQKQANSHSRSKHKHSTGGIVDPNLFETPKKHLHSNKNIEFNAYNETFLITEPNLEPATTYLISVFAINPKGESGPFAFEASTSKLSQTNNYNFNFRKGKC